MFLVFLLSPEYEYQVYISIFAVIVICICYQLTFTKIILPQSIVRVYLGKKEEQERWRTTEQEKADVSQTSALTTLFSYTSTISRSDG